MKKHCPTIFIIIMIATSFSSHAQYNPDGSALACTRDAISNCIVQCVKEGINISQCPDKCRQACPSQQYDPNACTWQISNRETDSMTSKHSCTIKSDLSDFSFYVYENFISIASYGWGNSYNRLMVQVDNNSVITINSNSNRTDSFYPATRYFIEQLSDGQRLRVRISGRRKSDAQSFVTEREMAICHLPNLIQTCQQENRN